MSPMKMFKLTVSISLTVIGLATAVTTLVYMGHNNNWANPANELVGVPLVIVGFSVALTMFIISCVVSNEAC